MKATNDTMILIGRPGKDPSIKHFGDQKMMARFSFAVNEEKADENGEPATSTSWHKVVAWGRCAALVEQKVRKGRKMTIVGKRQCRQYTDTDGKTKEVCEIVLFNLSLYQHADAE